MPPRKNKSTKNISSAPKRGIKKRGTHPADRPGVLIIGDRRIVDEYSMICQSHGLDVVAVVTNHEEDGTEHRQTRSPLPKPLRSSIFMVLELSNLSGEIKKRNLKEVEKAIPATVPILSTSVTISATEQSTWLDSRDRHLGFAAVPGLCTGRRVEVAPTVFTSTATLDKTTSFFQSLEKEIEFVQDCVGMVMPRLICQLINEAMFLCQEEVAHPHDIDTVGTIALGSSKGPITMGDKISLKHVAAVLRALQRDLGDPRYRLSPILSQLSVSDEWWKRKTMIEHSSE